MFVLHLVLSGKDEWDGRAGPNPQREGAQRGREVQIGKLRDSGERHDEVLTQ